MDIKLLGSCSFAGFAIIAMVNHFAGASTEPAQKHPLGAGHANHSSNFSYHDRVIDGIHAARAPDKATDLTQPSGSESVAFAAPFNNARQPSVSIQHSAPPASIDRLQKALEHSRSLTSSGKHNLPKSSPRTRSFVQTPIAGFLHPEGFSRTHWQSVAARELIKDAVPTAERFLVMLDPGHGGTDPGARAHNGLQEKHLTLDIAQRARLFLTEVHGIDVVLTREHDHGLSRLARIERIKRGGADMVVSLHFNHLPQKDITLVESFYAGPENISQSLLAEGRTTRTNSGLMGYQQQQDLQHASHKPAIDLGFTLGSKRLAKTLQRLMFSEVSLGNEAVQNAGAKPETLFVLTRSFKPGALIEMTALSNVQEAEKLLTEEYKNRLAAALVDGIREYRDSLISNPLPNETDVGA